jgi:hypothetical protein
MKRIDTDTKAIDLFGTDKHGFTSGDPVAGISPTQLSADWCNDVQESIARTIEGLGVTLDTYNYNDLVNAIVRAIRNQRPYDGVPWVSWPSFQTHVSNPDDVMFNWGIRRRTFAAKNCPDNTTHTLSSSTLENANLPSNSVMWLDYHTIVVKADDPEVYHQQVKRASLHKAGTTLVVDNDATITTYNSGGLSVTWTLGATTGGPHFACAIPDTSGERYNLFVAAEIRLATVGTW